MANLFGVDIRGIMAGAMGGLLLPVTLKVRTPGTTYDVNDPGAGPRYSEVSYACKGTFSVTQTTKADDGTVRVVEAKGVILLGTITNAGIVPKTNDRVAFTIPNTTTVVEGEIVGKVDIDDAGASASMTLKV